MNNISPTVTEIKSKDLKGHEIITKVITYAGNKQDIISYKNGLANGLFQKRENGRLIFSGHYKDGKPVGDHRHFKDGACIGYTNMNNQSQKDGSTSPRTTPLI